MVTNQDDIPEGLCDFLKRSATSSDVSVSLTDELLDAAVNEAKTVEEVDFVSADDRIVSFVDLLGTKSLMNHVSDKAQAQDTYNKLSAIGVLFRKCIEDCLGNVPDKTYRIISDSYVISVPDEPEAFDALILSIAKFQRGCLLNFKELARGGVAKGKMVVGGDMMIGKAFVDAHILEAKIASYPRVVINSDIKISEISRNALISHDKDGMDYVSFLSGSSMKELETAHSIVQSKKKEKPTFIDLHDRQKWEWAQTYIDQVINGNLRCCACKKEVGA